MEMHTDTPSNVIPIQQSVPKPFTIKIPDIKKIGEESREVVAFAAKEVTVVNHQDYLIAGERLKAIVRAIKQVTETFADPKDAAHKAHASICAAEKKLLEPLKKVQESYGKKVKVYLLAVEEKKRLDAIKARADADEEARKRADEIRKTQDDERIKIAQQLHDSGFKEEAEAVLSQEVPQVSVAPVIIKPVEKLEVVQGQSLRKKYKFIVDNLMLLVQEVAAGRQPLSFLLANESVLNKMAAAAKLELRIPGGYVQEDSTLINRDTSTEDTE